MGILDKAFIKGDDLMTRNIAGETLIVPVRKRVGDLSAIYTLNEVGARVWQMIDGKTRGAEIVRAIKAEYDVADDEAVSKDVTDLLASMADAGLISQVTESAA
jgi:Coenzyme PQQ synthesis protein D (PqqD)